MAAVASDHESDRDSEDSLPSEEKYQATAVEKSLTDAYLKGELSLGEFAARVEAVEEDKEVASTSSNVQGVDGYAFELQLQKEQRQQRKKHSSKKNPIPKDLQGLMGEANLCFARGEHDDAIKMCMEIIRLAPRCPDPFQLLGMICEEKGDMDKSLQFLLIAAHLGPNDPDEWAKLAEMSLEQDNVKQAITCYNKAIKSDPQNFGLLWEKAKLLEQMGEQKKALESYRGILKLLPEEHRDKYMDLARMMTRCYHVLGDTEEAIKLLTEAIEKHSEYVNLEDVNMLAELKMSVYQYKETVDFISRMCRISITSDTQLPQHGDRQDDDFLSIFSDQDLIMPDTIPIDLRVKLGICLIHCLKHAVPKTIFEPLFSESPEEMGDLYLDIAEAYVEIEAYSEAKPVLCALVNSQKYNMAAVWLRYAECLHALGELEQAAEGYRQVLLLAPNHLSARITLSSIEQQLGRVEAALKALTQEGESNDISSLEDIKLVYHRCLLLLSQGKKEEFVDNGLKLLYTLLKDSLDKLSSKESGENYEPRIFRKLFWLKILKEWKDYFKNKYENSVSGDVTTISTGEWWTLFSKICSTLVSLKRYNEAKYLIAAAKISTTLIKDIAKQRNTDFMALITCYLSKDYRMSYDFIRMMLLENPGSIPMWNFFNQITMKSGDNRHHRFCLRMLTKHTNVLSLYILNGHNAYMCGSLKHALGEYAQAYKYDPDNPLICLCIGLTFIQMSTQKYAMKRNSLILQGFAFLHLYKDLRGECQETFYNFGRAFHQLGVGSMATHYYKTVLEMQPAINEGAKFDLRQETAFNLSLIYQQSGNLDLANHILTKYCTV